MAVQIAPLSEACGAEVSAVDLKAELSEADVNALDNALIAHGVLLFREQSLTPVELVRFSHQFGELQPHVQRAYQHPDAPEVVMMTNRKPDGSFDEVGARRGAIEDPRDGWHSDLSYDPNPAKATLLHAVEIPSRGGNTCFANVYAAYASLSDELKQALVGLEAEFRLGSGMRSTKGAKAAENLDAAGKRSCAIHPVVNVHPESGRPAIYVNPIITNRILGVSAEPQRSLARDAV